MKHSILLLLFTLLFLPGIAQRQNAHHTLQLHWGIGNITRQDFTVSPFVHQEWSPINFQLSYNRSKNLEQRLEVRMSIYNPSVVEPYPFNSFYNGLEPGLEHHFASLELNYALGKNIHQGNKWNLIIGGKSRNQVSPSDYNFGPSATPSPLFLSFGLDVWLNVQYELSDQHTFQSNLSLPVFSYIYRAPYLGQDDQFFMSLTSHNGFTEFSEFVKDGHLRSWNSSQRVDFDIRYAYVLTNRWNIGMTYLLAMNFNQLPTKYSQVESVIFISGEYKF